MKKALVFALALVFAAAAFAQQYKWVDRNGKTQYGDTPPPGVKATPLRGPSAPPSAPAPEGKAAAKDAKAAPKGPMTPAEQEADFRKRQLEAQKSREKEEKSTQDKEARRANCTAAQESVRSLESGTRISRTDAAGERYYVEDNQRAAELTKARKARNDWCN
jgi:hypothetical protein